MLMRVIAELGSSELDSYYLKACSKIHHKVYHYITFLPTLRRPLVRKLSVPSAKRLHPPGRSFSQIPILTVSPT
jgi:hypothetical protein